ncbi:MAG: tRNA (adenosine(37)-N6)-dimethylallyltransferase MiaA [Candidatus Vogelbacteria bacterium GWA1_51_14]|uniref:tRNA dimethylallyltransferase n=1 Tax=Candidatus Vogelbacteria bacterium GWA1_51_14 TaxID=1802435 RepID=A0A1G2Q9H4_9BACT|nr:MAG: tRNA (adenosine(37)-N6)-dimethylallyltransferase MiaA [Candidatus Vogelbacteria bacterium GWA1_51_14]
MANKGKKLIVIVGPTASGKSDLAVAIAKRFGGEVVSADSRQVYRGLDIGSGKITKREMRGVPHYLLGVASPKRTFTVAQYQKLATRATEQIWQRGKVAILVGGTGFYIQAVVDGLILPAVLPNQELRKKLNIKTPAELFKLLKKLDPKRAGEIDRHNPRRLIRAIEIAQALGRVPGLQVKPLGAKILMIGLNPNLADLKKKINVRLAKRLKQGMLAEVKKLRASGLSWHKLEDFGLEYRYLAQYLQGKISRPEMIEKLEREIYHYAKRQFTWFKRDKRIIWSINKKN